MQENRRDIFRRALGYTQHPQFLVAGILALSGWLATLVCTTVAFQEQGAKWTTVRALQVCFDVGRGCQLMTATPPRPPTPSTRAARVLGDSWREVLQDDLAFQSAFLLALPAAFDAAARPTGPQSDRPPERWPQLLYDVDLAANRSSEPLPRTNRSGCLRGPLGLTYRQGVRLGLKTLQPDPPGGFCEQATEPDDRDDIDAIQHQLEILGLSTRHPQGATYEPAALLVELGALDFPDAEEGDAKIDFSSRYRPPSLDLARQDVPSRQIDAAIDFAAEIAANGVARRCRETLAWTDPRRDHSTRFEDCAVLDAMADLALL